MNKIFQMTIPFILSEEHIHIIGGSVFDMIGLYHIPLYEYDFKHNSGLRTLLINLDINFKISNLDDFKSSILDLNYIMPDNFLYGHINLVRYKDNTTSVGKLYNDLHKTNIQITKIVNDNESISCNISTKLSRYIFKEVVRDLTINNILK